MALCPLHTYIHTTGSGDPVEGPTLPTVRQHGDKHGLWLLTYVLAYPVAGCSRGSRLVLQVQASERFLYIVYNCVMHVLIGGRDGMKLLLLRRMCTLEGLQENVDS